MGEVDPIGFIEGAPGLDDAERRAILGRNAARLLNIEMPPVAGLGAAPPNCYRRSAPRNCGVKAAFGQRRTFGRSYRANTPGAGLS